MWPDGKNRFPSSDDIAEMKARGYDSLTIAAAQERMAWGLDAEVRARALCTAIQAAFAAVKLGNGIGLDEAMRLDSCHCDRSPNAADEKDDWRKIPAEALNSISLSYFDAEGMRFHIPAYLIAELSNCYPEGLIFTLTFECESNMRFKLLSDAQRSIIRAYLLHLLEDPDYELDHPVIRRALDDYWTETPKGRIQQG